MALQLSKAYPAPPTADLSRALTWPLQSVPSPSPAPPREEGWGRQRKESWDLLAGRKAGGGRGKSPGTRGPGGGLGEAEEGVLGPGGREEGWGRQRKESRYQGVGRRAGGDRGRSPGT